MYDPDIFFLKNPFYISNNATYAEFLVWAQSACVIHIQHGY